MSTYKERVTDAVLSHPATEWVSKTAVFSGRAVMYITDGYPSGFHHPTSDSVRGRYLVEPDVAQPTPAPLPPPSCTVDGVEVIELAVLVKPVAFFVTTEGGTSEISRCYFHNGKFQYGVDLQRLNGVATKSVEYRPDRGLLIHFEKGYELFIPMSHCQATWRLPDVH